MSEEREKCGEMDGECEEVHGNAADEGQGEEWRPSAGDENMDEGECS